MTKYELVNSIHTATNISKKDSADIFENVFSLIKETLEAGETVKISKFGRFEVLQKKARKGRNPVTGEDLIIDARRVLTFKPSIALRQAINT